MAVESSMGESSGQEYEFTPQQEGPIRELAKWMAYVGWCLLVIGILAGLPALVGSYVSLIPGLLFICLGAWTRTASTAFNQIVETRSQDISHLMAAIRELLKMYKLQVLAIVIALVFQILMVSFSLLWIRQR